MMTPTYDPEAVRPMWEELEQVGVKAIHTTAEVDEALSAPGTTLLVVNSVCGCAAGSARPGVMLALQNKRIPDRTVTVFAGVDMEAVARARECMAEIPPSSPNAILFKDGSPVVALQRGDIETMSPMDVARTLQQAFDTHCAAEGPSIPREQFEAIIPVQECGSTIPLYGDDD
jgi:putative YphP/YqiW family bacilliredoxin